MASNFKIALHRDGDTLYLKLIGDFDGSSAWELLNNLNENCGGINQVFINTSYVHHAHPFGKGVLQSNFGILRDKHIRFFFTGEKASKITPEKSYLFQNPVNR